GGSAEAAGPVPAFSPMTESSPFGRVARRLLPIRPGTGIPPSQTGRVGGSLRATSRRVKSANVGVYVPERRLGQSPGLAGEHRKLDRALLALDRYRTEPSRRETSSSLTSRFG